MQGNNKSSRTQYVSNVPVTSQFAVSLHVDIVRLLVFERNHLQKIRQLYRKKILTLHPDTHRQVMQQESSAIPTALLATKRSITTSRMVKMQQFRLPPLRG